MTTQHNELVKSDIRLTGGLSGLTVWRANNSPSRSMMDASHLTQAVVLETPDRMDISSGMDHEYAKYTFDVKIKGEPGQLVKILKILRKYQRLGEASVNDRHSEIYVIYMNLETGVVDVSIIPKYYFNHMYFGFHYRYTDALKQLREGDIQVAGTPLAISPAIDNEEETYAFGLEAMTAMGSFKEVIEDGIGVSESFAKRMSTRRYGTLTVNYGKEGYLVNLYGTENNFKPFPDIGERIRDDGLLFAERRLDHMMSPARMTPKALMEYDPVFDKLYFGIAGAEVVDITVNHSHDPSMWHLPTDMAQQPARYFNNHTKFYRDLDKLYYGLKSTHGDKLKLSPELHGLIVKGMVQDHTKLRRGNKVTYRKQDIEEYRVTITYMIEEPLRIGHKLTDLAAAKGVVTAIIPDDQMPVDQYGRRAEVLVDANASIHRMDTGRKWELELNFSLEQERVNVERIYQEQGMQTAFEYLLSYYRVASPGYYELISNNITDKHSIEYHLHQFINNETSLLIEPGTVNVGSEHSLALSQSFPPKYGKVTLSDLQGRKVESKFDMMIGKVYMIRLEKIGNNWSATSLPSRQLHGMISKLSNINKTQLPWRNQGIRFGETEIRLLMSAANPVFASSLLLLANNSDLCNKVVENILNAENPALIKEVIPYQDLDQYPSRSLDMIKHIMACYGYEFYYDAEENHDGISYSAMTDEETENITYEGDD